MLVDRTTSRGSDIRSRACRAAFMKRTDSPCHCLSLIHSLVYRLLMIQFLIHRLQDGLLIAAGISGGDQMFN